MAVPGFKPFGRRTSRKSRFQIQEELDSQYMDERSRAMPRPTTQPPVLGPSGSREKRASDFALRRPKGFEGSIPSRLWQGVQTPEFDAVTMPLPIPMGAAIGGIKNIAKLVKPTVKGVKTGDIPFFGGGSKKLLRNLPKNTQQVFEEHYAIHWKGLFIGAEEVQKTARGKLAEAVSRADIVDPLFPRGGTKTFKLTDRSLPGDEEILRAGEDRLTELYRVWRSDKDAKLLKTLFERGSNVTEVPRSISAYIDPSFGEFPQTLQRALLRVVDKDMNNKMRTNWMSWVGTLRQGRGNDIRDKLGKYGKAHPRELNKLRNALRAEYGDEILVFRTSSEFPGGLGGLGGLTTPTSLYTSVSTSFNHAAMFLYYTPKHLRGKIEMAKIPVNKVFAFGGIDESELIIGTEFGQKMTWLPMAAPIGIGYEDTE